MRPLTSYDTIRDAILTCARKLTQINLIYRTEPTTKNWEKKYKVKTDILGSIGNSPGSPCRELSDLVRCSVCNKSMQSTS